MKTMMAALLLALAAPSPPPAPQNEAPKAFLERVYAEYVLDGLSSLQHVDELFSPELAARIRRDAELAGDEVGYLDGDPLCDCQEAEGLKPHIEEVREIEKGIVEARVFLDFGPERSRAVTLRLVLTPAGWRVADVATKEEPSLLRALEESNRQK